MTSREMTVRLDGWRCENCGEGWTTCWCEVRRKEQAEREEARWEAAKANALTPVAAARLKLFAVLELFAAALALLVLGGALLIPFFNL